MKRHMSTFAALAVGLLLLTSCGSSGGSLGDILGGGTSNQSSNEIRGTVDRIDLNNKIIYLTNTYSSMLSSGGSGGGSTATVYFDNRTSVDYQGQTYRPEDLERGDEVSVRVTQSGNQLVADQVTVLRNVSSGTGTGTNPGSYNTNVRGTIRTIDTSRRTMTVDRSNGTTATLEFDNNTYVTYNGNSYTPQDLERGDEVDITAQNVNGRLIASNVNVLRSVSGGTTNTAASTIRGTVLRHDPSRRTIELEQTSWLNNFNRSTGNTGGRVIIQYPSNIGIEVSGQVQSISGLEPGDVVDVQVQNPNATTPIAQRIILVRDVNYR